MTFKPLIMSVNESKRQTMQITSRTYYIFTFFDITKQLESIINLFFQSNGSKTSIRHTQARLLTNVDQSHFYS